VDAEREWVGGTGTRPANDAQRNDWHCAVEAVVLSIITTTVQLQQCVNAHGWVFVGGLLCCEIQDTRWHAPRIGGWVGCLLTELGLPHRPIAMLTCAVETQTFEVLWHECACA
jgi:hypothetical protein